MFHSIRITCVIACLGCGGAERSVVNLADYLSRRGYQVTLLTIRSDIADFYPIPKNVTRIFADPQAARSHRWFNLPMQWQRNNALRSSLLSTYPDLVVSFSDTTNIFVLQVMAGSDVPIVVSERTDPRFHPIGWRWELLRSVYYPTAKKVVFQTEATCQWAKQKWPCWDTISIPNPIAPPPAHLPVRSNLLDSSKKTVVAMGRLHPVKGFNLLLDAFSLIAEPFPDWQLVILGEGDLRSELAGQIEQLNLSERVSLPGAVSEPTSVLKYADLFVLSSHYEGFPNALLEAMACGLPVVSFDCPSGPAEIIRDCIDGVLVPPRDVQALSTAMADLMSNELERQNLGTKATKVVQRFSVEKLINQWQKVISDCAAL